MSHPDVAGARKGRAPVLVLTARDTNTDMVRELAIVKARSDHKNDKPRQGGVCTIAAAAHYF